VRPGPALAAGIAQGDLPRHCAVGTKRNAKGHMISWIGYKLHLDIADGECRSAHERPHRPLRHDRGHARLKAKGCRD
jgi:hypothetical protein